MVPIAARVHLHPAGMPVVPARCAAGAHDDHAARIGDRLSMRGRPARLALEATPRAPAASGEAARFSGSSMPTLRSSSPATRMSSPSDSGSSASSGSPRRWSGSWPAGTPGVVSPESSAPTPTVDWSTFGPSAAAAAQAIRLHPAQGPAGRLPPRQEAARRDQSPHLPLGTRLRNGCFRQAHPHHPAATSRSRGPPRPGPLLHSLLSTLRRSTGSLESSGPTATRNSPSPTRRSARGARVRAGAPGVEARCPPCAREPGA